MAQTVHEKKTQTTARRGTGGIVVALCLLAIGVTVVARLFGMDPEAFNTWGALLVGPLLFAISLPILAREARKQGDPRLMKIFVLGLLLMFAGALVRYYVTYAIYDGSADATGYHGKGVRIAEEIASGNLGAGLDAHSRTDFIRWFTGFVYTIISPTRLGGFLFYAWLAYWGLFFFFKAFTIGVPEGRALSYGRLLFFYPSLLYWPATIGKDAWMLLWLGVGALGVATALKGKTFRGLAVAALGLALAGLVRAPVAAMLGVALAAAYFVRRPSEKLRGLGPIVKIISMVLMTGLTVFMISWSGDFLNADLSDPASISNALESTSQRADHGGSEFDPIVVRTPFDVPPAIITTLFRPFFFEAHNLQALISAVEGMILFGIIVLRWRWFVAAIRRMRKSPYLVFALVFATIFAIAFASFPNFGLLARQRVQLFPLLFVLFCIPPGGKDERELDRAQSS